MNKEEIITITRDIVRDAKKLSALHTNQGDAPVNYACIFSQNMSEYNKMVDIVNQFGSVASETSSGPVFKIPSITTESGSLQILKIRRPDPKRLERGDADFTVLDFSSFKNKYLNKDGFSLIKRENMEMIELIDTSFDVIAYYSNPILVDVLNIKLDNSNKSH